MNAGGKEAREKRMRRGFNTVAFGSQHNGINETLTDMVSHCTLIARTMLSTANYPFT